MKQGILLSILVIFCIAAQAQKKQKKPVTAYAITAVQKGQNNWTEVRLIDVATGEEVKTIYQSSQEVERLNARTGKPIVIKAPANLSTATKNEVSDLSERTVTIKKTEGGNTTVLVRKIRAENMKVQSDKPFATNSAACAYDKKHERLYYTPMGISQLRYIDLKSKTPRIYYFEDEAFGPLKTSRDVSKQITRMVIGSDGNGYALTNDANHLLRFSTKKKPQITDLGALSDEAANTSYSVHNAGGYGGDMIADASGGLYLITANRGVFKIDLSTMVASFKGFIKGLPKGYTTNGAIAEGGKTVIVNSSNSTQGYFRFDLTTLQAEKVSGSSVVFNSSDLANGVLAFEKKEKDENPVVAQIPQIEPEEVVGEQSEKRTVEEMTGAGTISVYPNPVTNGLVRLSFNNQPVGRYQIQLVDVAGRLISSRPVTVNNKTQVEEFRLSGIIAGGSYLVKVFGETNGVSISNKIVVQ